MLELIVDDTFLPENVSYLIGIENIVKIEPGIKFPFEPGFLQTQVYIVDGSVYIQAIAAGGAVVIISIECNPFGQAKNLAAADSIVLNGNSIDDPMIGRLLFCIISPDGMTHSPPFSN
jgi:hypothetical protein